MMKNSTSEYQDRNESSSVLWELRKKIFSVTRYSVNVLLMLLGGACLFGHHANEAIPVYAAAVTGGVFILLSLSVRVAYEWERVPVLRLGRYIRTAGPGLFFVIPFIDRTYEFVDCRITVTDFSAEKTLTKDAVPVYVDAIIFWMIWDAGKAKLEVENFRLAVPLSAKTALRDIIGKTTLADLLTERDTIGAELQKILDSKTNPWGITSLSVEIKDIVVPKELEDAISREAQAEREKNARIILGSAEVDLSERYALASQKYKGNEEALTLRSLNMLLDAVKSKGSMILVPSETPKTMNNALSIAMARKTGSQQAQQPELPSNEVS